MGLLAYKEIICLTEMKCVLLMLKVHTQKEDHQSI